MLLADVNVFVYAHRPESPHHGRCKSWLQQRLAAPEPFGVSELVLSSLVRIVTNHRIFREPATPEQALDFCAAVLAAPAATPVRPGSRHWSIFAALCRSQRARGNAVPDCYLAALALEHNATWVTLDRGFGRFTDLRLLHPLDE